MEKSLKEISFIWKIIPFPAVITKFIETSVNENGSVITPCVDLGEHD
jgi:hypothetical protein